MVWEWRKIGGQKKLTVTLPIIAIKDIDNDGKPEIVLALVLSVGASLRDKSVIVVYKLDTAQ